MYGLSRGFDRGGPGKEKHHNWNLVTVITVSVFAASFIAAAILDLVGR